MFTNAAAVSARETLQDHPLDSHAIKNSVRPPDLARRILNELIDYRSFRSSGLHICPRGLAYLRGTVCITRPELQPIKPAANTVLVLAHNSQGMTLYGRGRDIKEIET